MLDRIVVTDPEIEIERPWLSKRMQESGLVAAPAYTFHGREGRISVPYRDGDFEVCFIYDRDKKTIDARLSDGKVSFWFFEYQAFQADSLDDLIALSWADGLKKILGAFDENLELAIKSRGLPNIPSCSDLKAIAELKIRPFLSNLGFFGEENPRNDLDQKYAFKKGDIQLLLATAGRLDDGYVGIKTPKGFFDYDVLLKMLANGDEAMEQHISRWMSGGYYAGNYYKIAQLIEKTFADILEKVLPKL